MKLEQLGLTEEQAAQLLTLAAKKLGIAPEELARQVEEGKYDALLQTPQARALMKGLTTKPK